MTALIACIVLTVALAVFIFFPEKKVTAQREKTRLEYLGERKAVIYDNLRDLSFEHRSGKYRDEEFFAEQGALETEAAEVVAEMDLLQAKFRASVRTS
jgi:hypothetical protein